MIHSPASQTLKPSNLSWCERNGTEAYAKFCLLTGIALAAITLALVITSAGTSHYDPQGNQDMFHVPKQLLDSSHPKICEINQAVLSGYYTGLVGGIAGGLCSLICFITAFGLEVRKTQAEKVIPEKVDAEQTIRDAKGEHKRRVMQVIFLTIALFAVGLIIGASIVMQHGINPLKEYIEQGRINYPEDSDFWNKLQSVWLDPTQSHMKLILAFGVLGSAVSGVAFAMLTGAGFCKSKQKQTEKPQQEEPL